MGREMGCGRGMDLGSEMGWGSRWVGEGSTTQLQAGCPSLSAHRQKHKQTRVHKTHKSENSISAMFHSVHLVDTKILQRYG